jgi:hypothetical protein
MAGTPPTSIVLTTQILDITAVRKGELVTITVVKDKLPFAKTNVTIINPQTWEKTKTTSEDGTTSFTLTGKGLYLLETEWIDTTKGNFKGKDYESIRYKSETTLMVD